MKPSAPLAALLVATAAVSAASLFIRLSASDPLVIAFWRMGLTAVLLAPALVWFQLRHPWRASRRDAAWLVLVGLVLALHFAFWITSLRLVSVAASVVLVTSHPIFVAPVSHYLLGDRVTGRTAAGIALGLTGVAFIGVSGDLAGNLLALGGGAMAGVYLLLGRRLRRTVPVLPYATAAYAFAALFLAGFALATRTDLWPSADLTREFALFLLMAVVSTIFGHTLYNWALGHVPATLVSVALVGEPIGASLLVLAFLGEVPPVGVFVGAPFVLAGVYAAVTDRPEPAN